METDQPCPDQTLTRTILIQRYHNAQEIRGASSSSGLPSSRTLSPQPTLGIRAVQLSVSHDGAYAAAAGTDTEVTACYLRGVLQGMSQACCRHATTSVSCTAGNTAQDACHCRTLMLQQWPFWISHSGDLHPEMGQGQSDASALTWMRSTSDRGLACECYRWHGIQVPVLATMCQCIRC